MDIELKSIYKSFGRKVVLNGLSYTFKSGDNYMISGRNGAGKTTLFKILAGIMSEDAGEISLRKRSEIGWVSSSEIGLMGRLTGLENIKVISKLIPSEHLKNVDEKIERWSKVSSFEIALMTPFFKCSSGMKQILKIFCATLHGPRILIMDEPFRNLDSITRSMVSSILSENNEIQSIIYSCHFTNEINIKKTHLLQLEEGKLIDLIKAD